MYNHECVEQTKMCPECGGIMIPKVYRNDWNGREKIVWKCKNCKYKMESCER